VSDIIAFLSGFYQLEAGDLIYTGTPAGVGAVVPGDEIVVAVAGLTPTVVRVEAVTDV
jgi:fumarylpyruvate hydrolase